MTKAQSLDGFVMTDEEVRFDFSAIEEPATRIAARGLINLMDELWRFLETPTTRQQAQRAVITLSLVKLCWDYIHEIEQCEKAFFAQGVLCCSLVETFLMLVCLRERDKVARSKQWRRFVTRKGKSGKPLHEVLPFIELGTLIDIGDELGWFSITEERLEPFTHLDEWNISTTYKGSTPREVVGRLQHFRNGIHPGKALRERFNFDEQSNKGTLWLAFASLAGVLTYAQDLGDLTMRLRIHPAIKAALSNESEMLNAVQAGLILGVASVALPDESGVTLDANLSIEK